MGDEQDNRTTEIRVIHSGVGDEEGTRAGRDDCIIIHYLV